MKQRRVVFWLAGALLAAVILAITARPAAQESAFSYRSAQRHGARALGLYMRAHGWDVQPAVTDPASVPADTGVLLVPREFVRTMTAAETEALQAWAEAGGRLVMFGEGPSDHPLLPVVYGMTIDEPEIRAVEPSAHFPGVGQLAASSYRVDHLADEEWAVQLRDDVGALVLHRRHGAGDMFVLPDAMALSNAALGQADNLAFALQLLAADGRAVLAFYARDPAVASLAATGGEAAPLPLSWRLAGLGFVLAAAASFWLLGRRTGPILPPAPAPNRPLTEYVTAQAHAYRKADAGGAVAGFLAEALRRDLAAASGLSATAPASQLAAAGERLGVSPAEVEHVLAQLEARGNRHPRDVKKLAASVAALQRRMKRVH